MKTYTRTGDCGKTSFNDGRRIDKNCIIFDVIGELDELNSRIGVACGHSSANYLFIRVLREAQCKIHDIIATIDKRGQKLPKITIDDVSKLEDRIDNYDSISPKLNKFILPGVTELDASIHMCRTQTRKVERKIWSLHQELSIIIDEKGNPVDLGDVNIDPNILKYINRLSDFFFSLARYTCHKSENMDCFTDDFS
jgi:cob(I)alamin adenosyltransferase